MGLFGPPNIEKIKAKKDIQGLIKALHYMKDDKIRESAADILGDIGDSTAVLPLIDALNDKDRSVQLKAIVALGKIADKRSVESLITMLKNKDEMLRSQAIEALGNIKDARAVEPLIEVLMEKNSINCISAIEALKKIKDRRAIEPLVKFLEDQHANVRKTAASALSVIGWVPKDQFKNALLAVTRGEWSSVHNLGIHAIRPLKMVLKDPEVIYQATESLAKLDIAPTDINIDPDILKLLSELLCYNEPLVRESAVILLGKLQDKSTIRLLLNHLADANNIVRKAALESLYKIDPKWNKYDDAINSVPELLKTVNSSNKPDVIEASILALSHIHDHRAIPIVLEKLKHQNFRIRDASILCLGKIAGPSAIQPLLALLKDKKFLNPRQITRALIEIGPSSISPLLDVLKECDKKVNNEVAFEISRTEERRALRGLILLLVSDNIDLQKAARKALDSIDHKWIEYEEAKASIFDIESHLNKANSNELMAIAKFLTQVKTPKAGELLMRILDNESIEIRQVVIEGLGLLRYSAAVNSLINILFDKNEEIRLAAVKALGQIAEPKAIEPLFSLLSDENWRIRKEAVKSLKNIGWKPLVNNQKILRDIAYMQWNQLENYGEEAVKPLTKLLTDKNAEIRRAAADTLGKIRHHTSIEPLLAVLKDEVKAVSVSAAHALGNIGDPIAIDPLFEAAKDGAFSSLVGGFIVMKASVEALIKIGSTDVVEPLLSLLDEFTYEEECYQLYIDIVIFFENILMNSPDKIGIDSLNKLKHLKSITLYEYRVYGDPQLPDEVSKRYDCPELARLARKELRRRDLSK